MKHLLLGLALSLLPSLAWANCQITDNTLGVWNVGLASEAVIPESGCTLPTTAVLVDGSLPPGLAFASLENGAAVVRGTPTTAGVYSFGVTLTDAKGNTSLKETLVINVVVVGTP